MKPNLISARINDKGVKMIAYLLDLQTISLFDLNTSTIVSQISHDSKIDYL
jgi:intraflagellar transport protein 172